MALPKPSKNTKDGDFDILQLAHGRDFDTWDLPRVGIFTINIIFQNVKVSPGSTPSPPLGERH